MTNCRCPGDRRGDVRVEDAKRRARDVDDDERERLLDRLERARSLFGGVDALQHFLAWKTPEER
jgi:hypothetical protein